MNEKVAILTAFREFVPGYSLTGIVLDQVELLRRGGHHVDVFVTEDYHGRRNPDGVDDSCLKKVIPKAHLKDYTSSKNLRDDHKVVVDRMSELCVSELKGYDMILTHDFIFTGWNVPYGQGILKATRELPDQRWLHWIHSVPSGSRDYWDLGQFGTRHKLVYPNKTDTRRVAQQFRTELEQIRVIPHPVDIRRKLSFGDLACKFVDDHPEVLHADVVQIYPAAADRLDAKRVREMILIFAEIKKMGNSVCLVLANQHASTKQRAQEIGEYNELIRNSGLTPEEAFFTSTWQNGKFKEGLPHAMLMDLFKCSNLFIFPTREETFGLVLPEAVLAGGVLPIMNRSLAMMMEITGMTGDYIDFGSFNQQIQRPPGFEAMVAEAVMGRLKRNESVMCKTFIRQKYNWDTLYRQYYKPIFAESVNW